MGAGNVYLFVPNLIGYARILLALLAFHWMPTDPALAMAAYAISCLLDAVDGLAARALGQSECLLGTLFLQERKSSSLCGVLIQLKLKKKGSRFGAVLDMVTDRFTTAGLLVYLGHRFPAYLLWAQALIALDLTSHYAHMVSSLTLGSSSHKKVGPQTPWLLRLYYENPAVLFLVCAGNEVFLMVCYLLGWPELFSSETRGRDGRPLLRLLLLGLGALSAPVFAFKQILNGIQLLGASSDLVQADQKTLLKGKSPRRRSPKQE